MIDTRITAELEASRTGRFLASVAGLLALSLVCFGIGGWSDKTGAFGPIIAWAVVGVGMVFALSAIGVAGYTLIYRPDILKPRIRVVARVEMPLTRPKQG